jgi:D-alanyl-D-alanine carboxypeptidase
MTTRPRRRAQAAVLLAAVAATFAATTAQADAGRKGELRKLVHEGVPGATVLVRDGDRTSVVSAGHAALDPKIAMRSGQRFRIGSITKPMVATVVLQLVGEGRIALDQPITDIVGKLAGGDPRVTVRDLLAHTSGISEYTDNPRVFAPYLEGRLSHVWSPQQLIRFAGHRPPSVPGTAVRYSNTNYVLLGLIVEKVTGTSLQTQLRVRVFEPLGLDRTSLPMTPRVRGPHAHGYLVAPGGPLQDVTEIHPSVYWGAGNVVSTTRDIADFFDGLLGGRLLTQELLAEMSDFDPMSRGAGYGLGLSRAALPCGSGIGHDGAVAGYFSAAMKMDDGRTVVAMANSITLSDRVGTKRAQAQWVRLVTRAACGS